MYSFRRFTFLPCLASCWVPLWLFARISPGSSPCTLLNAHPLSPFTLGISMLLSFLCSAGSYGLLKPSANISSPLICFTTILFSSTISLPKFILALRCLSLFGLLPWLLTIPPHYNLGRLSANLLFSSSQILQIREKALSTRDCPLIL
jgi:hypothetical protein